MKYIKKLVGIFLIILVFSPIPLTTYAATQPTTIDFQDVSVTGTEIMITLKAQWEDVVGEEASREISITAYGLKADSKTQDGENYYKKLPSSDFTPSNTYTKMATTIFSGLTPEKNYLIIASLREDPDGAFNTPFVVEPKNNNISIKTGGFNQTTFSTVSLSQPVVAVTPQPSVSGTGDDGVYTLLAPIGGLTIAPTNIGDYFNIIFTIAIGLCGVLAVIMIVIGGVQYMGEESIFGKTEAKERITKAILGLLIALGSYALLNTINPDLLGGSGVSISQAKAAINMEVHGDIPQSGAINGKYCNGRVVAGAEIDTITGKRWDNDSYERNAVGAVGITVQRSTSCVKVGESGCTTLTGLNTSSLINFKQNKCKDCQLIINGATECWNHSPETLHFPGNSIVDLDNTPSLTTYVQSGKKQATDSGFDQYTTNGTVFLDEKTHYHIISW